MRCVAFVAFTAFLVAAIAALDGRTVSDNGACMSTLPNYDSAALGKFLERLDGAR